MVVNIGRDGNRAVLPYRQHERHVARTIAGDISRDRGLRREADRDAAGIHQLLTVERPEILDRLDDARRWLRASDVSQTTIAPELNATIGALY